MKNPVSYLKETYGLTYMDVCIVMAAVAEQVIDFESRQMDMLVRSAIEDLKRQREKNNG